MVDARLQDGSRVNAIIPPLALDGPCLSIRRFTVDKLTSEQLIAYGSMSKEIGQFINNKISIKGVPTIEKVDRVDKQKVIEYDTDQGIKTNATGL